MRLDQLLRFAGVLFEKERVPYFIFGATAMNFWIPPRNTVDLDVVAALDKRRAVSLVGKLRKEKCPIPKDYLRKLLEGRIIKVPLGDTELDLKLCRTAHEEEALARAKFFQAADYRLRVAVPEDLVLLKLQAWRRQDQADIERMLNRKDLDIRYIEVWLGRLEKETGHPMKARWDEIRGS